MPTNLKQIYIEPNTSLIPLKLGFSVDLASKLQKKGPNKILNL